MACSLSEKVCRPAASRMMVLGMTIRAVAIVLRTTWTPTGCYQLLRIDLTHLIVLQRCSFNGDERIDRERFRVRSHPADQRGTDVYPPRDLVDQPDPVLRLLSQTQDTTRAHRDTSISHRVDGSEPFIVATTGDDLA